MQKDGKPGILHGIEPVGYTFTPLRAGNIAVAAVATHSFTAAGPERRMPGLVQKMTTSVHSTPSLSR